MCSEKKKINTEVDTDMDKTERSEVFHQRKDKTVRQFNCCKKVASTAGELNDWQDLAANLNSSSDG